jgi:3-isopropylmalate/(R)-2-methylmalate dehydratase small subunit
MPAYLWEFMSKLKGRVWKYGDDVNTDEIIPARYLNLPSMRELAKHCMEDIDKNFMKKVRKGDIIVAGKNFGCGSSREHAPLVIKEAGVACVIAKNFARIFYRNAINIGLPILESIEAVEGLKNGEEIEIDLSKGIIKSLKNREVYGSQAYPDFMQEIIKAGGLMKWIARA